MVEVDSRRKCDITHGEGKCAGGYHGFHLRDVDGYCVNHSLMGTYVSGNYVGVYCNGHSHVQFLLEGTFWCS